MSLLGKQAVSINTRCDCNITIKKKKKKRKIRVRDQNDEIGAFYHLLPKAHQFRNYLQIRMSLWKPRSPVEKFQHSVRAKNYKIGWIEEVRETVSLSKLGGNLLKILNSFLTPSTILRHAI